MFKSSYRITTVWGIPINAHISLIVLLLVLALQGGLADGPVGFILSAVISAAVFASIALHELGHSYVAIRKGCRVREITLMFMGGVAKMESLPSRPRDEFLMAIAGPLVSLVIGLCGTAIGLPLFYQLGFRTVGLVLLSVGVINLVLVGFNLIPAFPMDGGRVLRALLTPKLGRLKATFIASRIGRVVAVLMAIVALVPPFKLVLLAVAIFVYMAAAQEYRLVQVQEAMKQQGFGYGFYPWESQSFGGQSGPPPVPPNDDQVVVSPPPYRDGPDERTEIRSEDEDPFGLFRR